MTPFEIKVTLLRGKDKQDRPIMEVYVTNNRHVPEAWDWMDVHEQGMASALAACIGDVVGEAVRMVYRDISTASVKASSDLGQSFLQRIQNPPQT